MDECIQPAPEQPTPPVAAECAADRGEAPLDGGAEGDTKEAFAALLASSGGDAGPKWRKGDKVKAPVVRVTDEWVFVGLGTKEEGSVRIDEFSAPPQGDAEAAPKLPREGDLLEAYILSTQGGEVVLTTRLGRHDASKAALEAAWQGGIPVEGRVVQLIKGGFEVRVSGLRAFCPLSQIDVRWPKQPEFYVGQTYAFRVVEYKEKGRNVIVSRRGLLEEERARQRDTLVEAIVPGAVVTGTVRSVQPFGAFVDLGGIDALIPVSEFSWHRVENPAEALGEGQQVTAKVLTVDWAKDRVSLSLKALADDPWAAAVGKYAVGQRVTGVVARLAPFGAFVTLEPGVDGLVHISALGAGRRVAHPKEVLQTGQEVEAEILAVDGASRKISLSLDSRPSESSGSLPGVGEIVDGVVEKVMEFGVFVKLPSGRTGLVPNVEMGTARGTDHSREFRAGTPMEVLVLEIADGGKKIRLSRKGVGKKREDDDMKEYATQGQTQGASVGAASMGTFADLLKGRLKGKD